MFCGSISHAFSCKHETHDLLTLVSSTPESSYYDSCRQIADVIPEVSWDTDTHTASFTIAITESQQLAVVLAVNFPKKDTDTLYHITTWKIVNTQDWAADTSMKLLRTDTPESET